MATKTDIRPFIEAEIKKACPGDWHLVATNSLTWDWIFEEDRVAIVHGGPFTTDQNGNMVKLFKSNWEACVMDGDGVEMQQEFKTAKAAATHIRQYLGLGLPSCPECGGSGKVALFSHVDTCKTCGGNDG